MTCDLPAISIVVIGRNEGQRLVRCLESVRRADYPKERVDLIYVDSDSEDDSCATAERLGARVIAIRPSRPCAAAGRNAGLNVAQHDLVQFLDGDTILDPAWLRIAVEAMADPRLVAVFGSVKEVDPNSTIYNFWAHHDWYVPPGFAQGCGGIVMFRRKALAEAGGYDTALIAGEEQDLCIRLTRVHGSCLLCLDHDMVLHDSDMMRFSQYWRRCVRSGHSFAQIGSRHPELRNWRRTYIRNLAHAILAIIAVAGTLVLWSPWPVIAWALLLLVAIARNAMRYRPRLGNTRSALLYAIHHYISKPPTALGHMDYFLRKALKLSDRRLIEHRR